MRKTRGRGGVWVYLAVPAVVLAVAGAGAGFVYGMWKWDICCDMPGESLPPPVYMCGHGRLFRLGGLRWWARPAWLRITRDTAYKTLVDHVVTEADQILVRENTGH